MKIQPHFHFLSNVMATETISKVHFFLSGHAVYIWDFSSLTCMPSAVEAWSLNL